MILRGGSLLGVAASSKLRKACELLNLKKPCPRHLGASRTPKSSTRRDLKGASGENMFQRWFNASVEEKGLPGGWAWLDGWISVHTSTCARAFACVCVCVCACACV